MLARIAAITAVGFVRDGHLRPTVPQTTREGWATQASGSIREKGWWPHSNRFSENDSVKNCCSYPHNENRVVWGTLADSLLASGIFALYLPNL